MDRRLTARLAWLGAAALLLVAVVIGRWNPGELVADGQNEEAAVGLVLLAALLAGIAAWLRGIRSWPGAASLAFAIAVPLMLAGVFLVALANAPRYPYTVVDWRRVEGSPDAVSIDAALLPADVLAAMRAAPVGGAGCAAFMDEAQYRAFHAAWSPRDPNASRGNITVEGRTFALGAGDPCPIP